MTLYLDSIDLLNIESKVLKFLRYNENIKISTKQFQEFFSVSERIYLIRKGNQNVFLQNLDFFTKIKNIKFFTSKEAEEIIYQNNFNIDGFQFLLKYVDQEFLVKLIDIIPSNTDIEVIKHIEWIIAKEITNDEFRIKILNKIKNEDIMRDIIKNFNDDNLKLKY